MTREQKQQITDYIYNHVINDYKYERDIKDYAEISMINFYTIEIKIKNESYQLEVGADFVSFYKDSIYNKLFAIEKIETFNDLKYWGLRKQYFIQQVYDSILKIYNQK